MHDEDILEMPLDKLNPGADEMASSMCQVMQRYIPDVQVRAQPEAMWYWSKKAKEIRDPNAELIVWSPETYKWLREEPGPAKEALWRSMSAKERYMGLKAEGRL